MTIQLPHWTDQYQNSNWGAPDHWKTPINMRALGGKFRIQDDYWVEADSHLMQRRVEIELLTRVVCEENPDLYIELGAGNGALMYEILLRNARDDGHPPANFRMVGFEFQTYGGLTFPQQIELRFRDLFDAHCEHEIAQLMDTAGGATVVYCDNGNKLEELKMVAKNCKVGDVIGCHDFGIEVPQESVLFLEELGFEVLEKYEPWINNHLCLQRFWRKAS